MSESEATFLTGEAADNRLREIMSGAGADETKTELAIIGNRLLDRMLENLGIDPSTLESTDTDEETHES